MESFSFLNFTDSAWLLVVGSLFFLGTSLDHVSQALLQSVWPHNLFWMMECEWGDGYHFQARPIKTSHLCPPCSFHLCIAGERDDFGSYMTQISIHKRKGAWILKSPLGGESSTDPKYLFYLSVQFSHSVVSDSLWPHELQHARPLCPSPTLGVHPNPC